MARLVFPLQKPDRVDDVLRRQHPKLHRAGVPVLDTELEAVVPERSELPADDLFRIDPHLTLPSARTKSPRPQARPSAVRPTTQRLAVRSTEPRALRRSLREPPNLFVHRFRDAGDELRLPGSEGILEIAREACLRRRRRPAPAQARSPRPRRRPGHSGDTATPRSLATAATTSSRSRSVSMDEPPRTQAEAIAEARRRPVREQA